MKCRRLGPAANPHNVNASAYVNRRVSKETRRTESITPRASALIASSSTMHPHSFLFTAMYTAICPLTPPSKEACISTTSRSIASPTYWTSPR